MYTLHVTDLCFNIYFRFFCHIWTFYEALLLKETLFFKSVSLCFHTKACEKSQHTGERHKDQLRAFLLSEVRFLVCSL